MVTYMVYEAIFWGIVLCFQSTEEGLLSPENLNGTGRMFCQTKQASSVADESCTHELSDKGSQVGRNGVHSVAKVFGQLCSVCGDRDNLVA